MKIIIYSVFDGNDTETTNNSDLHVGTGNSVNSGVEFNCARYGVEVIGYTNPILHKVKTQNPSITFIPLSEIEKHQFDFVIINKNEDKKKATERLVNHGVNESKVFSFSDDFYKIISLFESSTNVAIRTHEVINGTLVTHTTLFDVSKKSSVSLLKEISQEEVNFSKKLLHSYEESEKDKRNKKIPQQLIVGDNWDSFLKNTRPNFYSAIKNKDVNALSELLNNFYRNEMSSGILGGEEAYNAFVHDTNHAGNFRRIFNVWKNSVITPKINDIACKNVGNPYGVLIDGKIINTNNMLNDVRAKMVINLIKKETRPVVLEIGGGYGGFADALLSSEFNGTYINFDLPENLIVSSYYINQCHPNKKIKLYDSSMETLSRDELSKYDILMLPHYMIEKLDNESVDLSINTISFSEMGYENISCYIKNITRTTTKYIYHENMLDGGAGYSFYPESTFPHFYGFDLLYSSPSRWPWFSLHSPFHHHAEFLYKKDSF